MSSINEVQNAAAKADVDVEALGSQSEVAVSAKRRRFAKLAFGAPVLMTLASRPVLAGQCLSNMMSGNLSDPNRGQCVTGLSPGGWGEPGGRIQAYSTVGAWTAVGLSYGTYNTNSRRTNQYNSYDGGSTLADVPGVLNKDGLLSTKLLREVLAKDPSSHQLTRHLVCAYLNSCLSELPGSSFHYILTKAQVIGLANGTTTYPSAFSNLQSFLGSTWT